MSKTVTLSNYDFAAMCTIEQVSDFIAVGRTKVLGTKADPYRKLSGKELRKAIKRDASQIWAWLQSKMSNHKRAVRAYRKIVRIQRGPKC